MRASRTLDQMLPLLLVFLIRFGWGNSRRSPILHTESPGSGCLLAETPCGRTADVAGGLDRRRLLAARILEASVSASFGFHTEVASDDAVFAVIGPVDDEACSCDHRFEEPHKRAVFVTNMFFEFGPRPAVVD